MASRERARRALDAMKALGFSRKEATPVLRSLLNLFDNSWEPIEDESYRALADAILDARDRSQNNQEQVQEHCRQNTAASMPEDDFPTPLAVIGTSRDLDCEADKSHIKRPTTTTNFTADCSIYPRSPPSTMEPQDDTMSSPNSNRLQTRASTRSRSSMADGMPSSLPAHKKARQMVDEDFQHAVFLKEPKPEPDMDTVQYNGSISSCQNDQNISSSAAAVRPLALLPPSKISGSKFVTTSTSFMEPKNTKMKQPQERGNASGHISMLQKPGTRSTTQEPPSLHTVVGSSAMGEVKLSMKCSIDPSNFRMPDLEAVFKMVEDKYCCLHKVIPPNFSIGSLMNEICQCVSQMDNYCTGEDNIKPDAVDNGRNQQNESMTHNALFIEPIACRNNGTEKDESDKEPLVMQASQVITPNAMVPQQPCLALSHPRPIHDVSDISKGEEKVRIPVINEFGSDKCPSFFYYIPRNLVFQKAHVNMCVTRIGDEDCCAGCFGNCLSAPSPCSCARETGGEFAYTLDGLVRTAFLDECVSMNRFPEKHHKFFCKSCLLQRSRNEASAKSCRGHIVRKFIKECWTKCGCNMQCSNRVVQRGMTCNLQVFFTQEGKGWGLRTLDELPKGAFVCEYVGELLTSTELHERASQNMHNGRYMHPVLLDANWGSEGVLKDEEALCLDATFYGNVGRFINHRCYDANLIEIPVEVETPDHHYYHLAFFTSKKVEAFEELTWCCASTIFILVGHIICLDVPGFGFLKWRLFSEDYGVDFDDDKHPVKAFECLCGSRYCRGRKHPRKRGRAAAK